MQPKTKNLILLSVAVLLLATAVVVAFRDSLFASRDTTSPEVRQLIEQTQKEAEPAPPPPAEPTFSKAPRKLGG